MTTARPAVAGLVVVSGSLPVLAEGGGAALIQPQIGTIFWTVVTFILLAMLLGRFAWKPLLGAIDAREASIRDTIERAEGEREQAQSLLGEHKALVAEARRERAEAVAQGQRDAEKVKAEILDEARSQREQLLKQTEDQVQAGLRQARAELRSVAVDLSLKAAEKLLAKNLDDATQRKLVEEYLRDLEGGGGRSLPS